MSLLPPSLSDDDDESKHVVTKVANGGAKARKQQGKEKEMDYSSHDEDTFNEDFDFGGLLGEEGDSTNISTTIDSHNGTWSYKSALEILEKGDSSNGMKPSRINVASIIAAARKNLQSKPVPTKQDAQSDETSSSSGGDEEDDGDESSADENENSDDENLKSMEEDVLRERTIAEERQSTHGEEQSLDSGSETDTAKEEAAKAAKYFEQASDGDEQEIEAFSQILFARPLLRGVAAMGFVSPTPIQARVIPVALSGRDVCASAITGSGKTAAFLLPVMERILQRGGGTVSMKGFTSSVTRGLVLTPTRELAAQCFSMLTAISKFTDIRAALVVGGAKNVAAQAVELRTRPDIVVGSPGRVLDHLTNSPGVDLDDIEFLILDEADRLLDLGFQDEIHEIVRMCPVERQTLLFSATMSTKVDELVKLSLKRPVRVHVTDKRKDSNEEIDGVEVANRLEQEFVRVRAGNEGVNREAMLLSLLTRTFTSRVIVFFDTKSDAHRLMILSGLLGIKATELHGNLTQPQRIEALEQFRSGQVDVLLATDLAARGLDIPSVKSVINFEMPTQIESYVHRIGRTARAGRSGKCCTLIGEGRRYLMKEILKDAEQKRKLVSNDSKMSSSSSTGLIRSRTIPQAVISHFVTKITSLESHVKEVIVAEAVARMDRIAEMEATRAQNIIEHSGEIKARERKMWFSTEKQKMSVKEASARQHEKEDGRIGKGLHRMTRKKRRLMEAKREFEAHQEEERKKFEESGGKQKRNMVSESSIKVNAKAEKNRLNSIAKNKDNRSIYDQDIFQENKRKKKELKAKNRKTTASESSVGDSGLFDEERVSFAGNDQQRSVAPSSYDFHGYDGNKSKRKKTKGAFKSKSKYKRR